MNRATKILAGVLCAGALTMGIGIGVAFAECSSFEIRELDPLTDNGPITQSATYEVPAEGTVVVSTATPGSCDVVADDAVAQNTVVITASCSGGVEGIEIHKPWVNTYYKDEYGNLLGSPSGNSSDGLSDGSSGIPTDGLADGLTTTQRGIETTETSIGIFPIGISYGPEAFNALRDSVLSGLKNGVLYYVDSRPKDFTVEIRVNPADINRITTTC